MNVPKLNRILKLYNLGYELKMIARETGLTVADVKRAVKKHSRLRGNECLLPDDRIKL